MCIVHNYNSTIPVELYIHSIGIFVADPAPRTENCFQPMHFIYVSILSISSPGNNFGIFFNFDLIFFHFFLFTGWEAVALNTFVD